MKTITIKAKAKINLNLYVLNKREDNYHNLKSIFQKINLYDYLTLKKHKDYKMITNIPEINNENNIIYKAYLKLKDLYPQIKGVEINLQKNIPMQAGLGGGSTDCASFLIAMNKLYNLKMTSKEIEAIGVTLGADVIPCLHKGTMLVEGIGDIVKDIPNNTKYYLVIVKPSMNCSTKEMYNRIDSSNEEIIDKTDILIKALKTNNISLIKNNLYNSFERVVDNQDIINNIKKELLNNGSIESLMTGSGSCIFGIFKTKYKAQKAYNNIKNKYEVYICSSAK